MDKYEYRVRAEQIKSLLENREFEEAMKVANTIDWRRVKSISMLCTVSEIYKINRKYEESREILLMAYERYPTGRTIVYALCELSIKMEDVLQAVEYYKEFLQIAPKDTSRYILQYKLYEAQEVSLEERIAVLEEFKKKDYREKWAYELAYLYHRVGLGTRCVEECDELILWFGEGPYVQKAMELKMLHEPLNQSQQEKYDSRDEVNEDNEFFNETTEENTYDSPEDEKVIPISIKSVDASQEPTREMPSRDIEEEIQVKPVNVDKYSTINLQEELSKSMQELFEEPGGLKIHPVEEPVMEESVTEEPVMEESVTEEPVMEESVTEEPVAEATAEEPEFERMLSQEYDGQISIALPDPEPVDRQITGQMDISDVMTEWEKMKAENDRRRIAEAKRRSLEQTNDIMSQLVGVIPGIKPEPLPEIEPIEPIKPKQYDLEEVTVPDDEDDEIEEIEDIDEESTEDYEDEEYVEDEESDELYEEEEESEDIEEESDEAYEDEEEPEELEEPEDEEEIEEESDEVYEDEEEPEELEEPEDEEEPGDDMDLFEAFLPMEGMREQIEAAKKGMRMMGVTGNVLLTGNEPSVRVKLGLALAKMMQRNDVDFEGKVAKISAELLNTKDIEKSVRALAGGSLLIEKAGALNINTLDSLAKSINRPDARLLIILEDEKSEIRKIQKMREYCKKLFTVSINIPTYSNDDLVNHAKEYANAREYVIDEMGILALYTRIDEMQTSNHFVTISEVEEIMDAAIKHVDRKNMNHLMDVLFAKRYDEDDMIIIREKDFINKK